MKAKNRLYTRLAMLTVSCVLMGWMGSSFAQMPRPSDSRPELPAFGAPSADFELPPLAAPPSDAPLSSQLRVYVRSIRLIGNTVFSVEEVQSLIAPYVGREVSSEELQQLRYELSLLYVENGYINSGVIIPDQQVRDGEIVLQVIEGELSRVEISGAPDLRTDMLRDRIMLDTDKPLNINILRDNLQLLQQDPLIKRINSRLEPGIGPGESILTVDVEQDSPYRLELQLDNRRPPSIGSLQGELRAAHLNASGRGDRLGLIYDRSEGLDDLTTLYSLPLDARGWTLDLDYQYTRSEVVEDPGDDVDIRSRSHNFGLALRYPLIRSLNRTLDLSLRLERRKSTTFLFNRPFAFSDGVDIDDGSSRVAPLRLVADYLDRSENQVLALRSTFTWGMDAFGATVDKAVAANGEPDAKFVAWLGQFQLARRFGENNNQLILRTDAQLTTDPLLPLEQCAVGGFNTVRGYRENLLVRDACVIASAELRIPVLYDDTDRSRTQLALFYDYGRAWNKNRPQPDPEDISSAGVGVRWDPSDELHLEVYGAVAFRNIEKVGGTHDLQDSGIHFLLNYSFD